MLTDLPKRTSLPLAALAAVVLALAGCAGNETTKAVAEAAGMATTAQESKAFVRETRPADTQYIPIGTAITRTAPRKPVEDFKKLETQLEAKRQANEAAASQAQTLGATTAAPTPAKIPTN